MINSHFEGAVVVSKPESLTDEQCSPAYAMPVPVDYGNDQIGTMWVVSYQPSLEDLNSLNNGGRVWIQMHCPQLVPHAVFTLDENGESNNKE